MKMNAWNVYLFGKLMDTVFYTVDCDAEYVYRSLVDHDGCDSQIVVKKSE